MILKIKKATLKPNSYGNNIEISMVGVYDDNGKWIRWIKLNQELIDVLCETTVELDDATVQKLGLNDYGKNV